MAKSWHLDRRTFLRGVGVTLALPQLECMAESDADTLATGTATTASAADQQDATPKRFCGIYFPFGVSLPSKDSAEAQWRWFPDSEGRDFQFNESLKPLEQYREQVTVVGGLSHPNGRRMGAHDTGDTFLTGALLEGKYLRNSISLDQVVAKAVGNETRFASLTMSSDGGVGEPTRASTLSYNERGRPIPAINQPAQIFARLFGHGDADVYQRRREMKSTSAMLDRVLGDAKSMRRRLSPIDREKLDEYLASVRQIEAGVRQSQAWLEVPRPELSDEDRNRLRLESDDDAPRQFIRTMYDLIFLAFRTDSTRVATYQIASMADASSKAGKFPQLEGFQGSLHGLAHDWNKPGGAEKLGKWDRFMSEQLAYFLERLSATREGPDSLLDRSVVFYGSSNSQTHNNSNYPIVLAGGKSLGFQHGQYRRYSDEVPLSNLFVTMLNRLGVPQERFADSIGELSEV